MKEYIYTILGELIRFIGALSLGYVAGKLSREEKR